MSEELEDTPVEESVLDLPDDEVGELPALPEETEDPVEVETEEEEEVPTESSGTEEEEEEEEEEEPAEDVEDKEDKEEDTKEDKEEAPDLDAEAQLKDLFTPFKANGKMMEVGNVEDARTLMKMGANYNKKMAGLKPNLRLMKMLENNNLLDEEKLSYLIDLDKKNPDAVNKLVKESGVDPLEIDVEKDTEYTPSTYTVGNKEVELDAVLDDIKESPAFQDTVDIISNKWDESSKKVLLANPGIIKHINEHVDNGIYAQISKVVDSEKMMGRLEGLSDIEAYQKVGDALQAKGTFNAPAKAEPPTKDTVKEDKIKSRKKAASPTKSKPSKQSKEVFNPLALSDEEFGKLAGDKFL